MKKFSKIIINTTLVPVLLFSFSVAIAQTAQTSGYTVLAPLPGIGDQNQTTTLQDYLPAVFKLSIGIAAVLAFVMITFGGITYATTDSVFKAEKGKKFIEDAIWGLLLVIGAWVILYTINPQILKFNLSIQRPSIQSGEATLVPVRPMTPEQIAADKSVRDRLEGARVVINSGPCTQGQITNCTNLNGLGEGAIQGLMTLKSDCGCNITVTGGTEPGPHKSHGVGQSIVDLRDDPVLSNWLIQKQYMVAGGLKAARVPLSSGRIANFVYEQAGTNGTSTGAHWHVVF